MGTGPKILASLLENGDVEQHSHEINRLLENATDFICIVAFAKFSGWELIRKALAKRAAKGLKATFVIGLNFYQSEPRVLRGIRWLQSKATAAEGEINLYIGDWQSRETLHPKVYWVKGPSGEVLIVGSANMTWGGLAGNHELSARLSGPSAKHKDWLDVWIASRIENEEIVEATPDRIKDYEKRRNIYQATMKAAEQRAFRAMELDAGETLTLGDLLVEMRADHSSEGFEHSVARRQANLPKARASLAVLTRRPDVSQPAFLGAYEELVRHWHSSGIERGKTTVAKKAAKFQAALRALAAEQSNDPAILFDLLRGHFDAIPRAGINVLTEILHARNPSRFPVMNQNSVAGMGLANITGYPRVPNKSTVDGARYAQFTADAETLRQKLRLSDLSELDALFNYAYHRREEGGEDSEEE